MITPYTSLQQDDDFGLTFSNSKFDNTMTTAGGEATLTVPGGAPRYKAVFSYADGAAIWVALNATATVAGAFAATFAATDSELNPHCREVKAGDVIHFITGDTSSVVGVAFYSIGANN